MVRIQFFCEKKVSQRHLPKDSRQSKVRGQRRTFPSIVQIFVHVLDGYRVWFTYAYEDRLSEYERRRNKISTRKEVAEEEKEVDSLVMGFVSRLRDKDLDRVIRYRDGHVVETIRLGDMLHHLIEEELQHRGEINALFWQRDTDPPIISFQRWARGLRS